jgi:NAD(P)-dependent dehydrogenase (short-subunit alcohol dehydrogenase family)
MEIAVKDLAGKVAVVTGAASGIGAGIARSLAAEGMHVVVSDIEEAGAEALCAELSDSGVRSLAVRTDVADRKSVEELAEATFGEFGGAHVVCNNAGVCVGGRAHESSDEDWSWVFEVNVQGVIHGCQAFIPRLIDQGAGGHIVNTASIGGFLPGGEILGVYTASKAAVVGITESYADSVRPHGIGMSVLCPAFVATNLITAERNRPGRHGERPGELEPVLGAGFEQGMDPLTCGKWVVRGIRDEQLYIFPHPEMGPLVEDRFERVRAGFEWAGKQKI